MTVYAILHVPSGAFMPQLPGRGYTHLETEGFVAFDGPREIRIFNARKNAAAALRTWLGGAWEPDYECDDWGGNQVKIGASPPEKSPENRRAEDMVIAALTLNVVTDEKP